MPRARIDDNVGPPLGVNCCAIGWNDLYQRVIDGPREFPRVHYHAVLEMEYWRFTRALMLHEIVATFPERVPEQHGTFSEIDSVAGPCFPKLPWSHRAG